MNSARRLMDEQDAVSIAYADRHGMVLEKVGPLSHWIEVGEVLTDSNPALIGQEDALANLITDPQARFVLTDISFSAQDQTQFHSIAMRWLVDTEQFEITTTVVGSDEHSSVEALRTARAQAYTDQQLQRERAHFRSIYEQSPQLAVCISRSGSVVAASELLRERFLTNTSDQAHTALTDVLTRGKMWQALWQGADLNGMPIRAIDCDGRARDLEVSAIATHNPTELHEEAYFTLIDITERNASRIELMDRSYELEQISQRLQDSNKKLDQFASVAAHDLLAPLRRIAAFTEMLHEELEGQQGDSVAFALTAIRKSALSGQSLVDDILQLARISSMDSCIETLHLNDVFIEVASEFDYKLAEVSASVECDSGDIAVIGDTRLAKLIFRNLLSNAVKYRHPSRELKIVLNQTTNGTPHARIEVSDNGIGMESELAQKAFDPFVRLSDSADVQGHGLGLAIVQEAAAAMGWHVFAHAEPGTGTRMVLTAPIDNPSNDT